MSAYLSSTTFWGTPARLLGSAATSSEWESGGVLALGVATAALIALCVATRALERSVERRRERKRERERARKRREQETRAAFCADFLKNNGNCVLYATAGGDEERVDRNVGDVGDVREGRDVSFVRNERDGEKRTSSAERRRRVKARRAALRRAAWGTLIAASVFVLFPAPPQNDPKKAERDGETTVARQGEKDANRAWNAPNVEIREVADAEGTRWANATELQNAENKGKKSTEQAAREKKIGENSAPTKTGENGRNGGNAAVGEYRENRKGGEDGRSGETGEEETASPRTTFAENGAVEAPALVAYRADSETVEATPEARWVQTSSGKLTRVEQIRAESSLELAPSVSANSGRSANLSSGETKERASTENVAWRRRRSEPVVQNGQVSSFAQPTQNLTAAQNGQVSSFAQPTQNLSAAQNGQVSLFAQPAQNLTAAQNGQVSQFAQPTQDLTAAQNGQVSSFAQPTQNLSAAQNGQVSSFAQPAQNLSAAQNSQVSSFAQPAQNLTAAQNGQVSPFAQPAQYWQETSARDAVVASTYSERRDAALGTALAQEFAPSDPLIPYPSEERGGSIASVGYERRAAEEPTSLLERIDAEFQRIGARVQKSVLSIETSKRAKTKSTKNTVETGCGFLFQYKGKLYLATNTHVVKDATTNKSVKIFLPDQTTIHPTKIMTCADFDLAALELDPATLPTDGSVALCFFGDSDGLRVSNFVGTIGNPFGLRDTVTYGHVSSLQRRKNDFTSEGEQSLLEFIQIDASINPGNSGGPVYNARGEVVGGGAAIATTPGKSEGLAFAIPINLALSVLKSTIDAGGWSRSRMGVELETATRADFQDVVDWPIKSGSKIVNVNANSPAERAGLRRGDVVVEFDGEAIEDDVHFARLIAIADVSRTANVKFLRGAELLQTTARLERSAAK